MGQNPLSSLPNQINSVVHSCHYSFPGGLLWIPPDHGENELALIAAGECPTHFSLSKSATWPAQVVRT
jgi:hypothetical protein